MKRKRSLLKEIFDDADMMFHYDLLDGSIHASKWVRWWYRLDTLFWYFRYRGIAPLICKIKGHRMEMDAFISREAGIEHWECTRCGIGGSHIYY